MPRKYIRPKQWHPPRQTAIDLTGAQRRELAECTPAKALRCVEFLAMQVQYDAQHGKDKWTEARAALNIFQSKTEALLDALKSYDDQYRALVDIGHSIRSDAKGSTNPFPSLTNRVVENLEDLKLAIDFSKADYRNSDVIENEPASLLRQVFDHFGIPFNRSKKSPAVTTLHAILKMANEKTTIAAAESKIAAAKKAPRYEFAGMYVAAMHWDLQNH